MLKRKWRNSNVAPYWRIAFHNNQPHAQNKAKTLVELYRKADAVCDLNTAANVGRVKLRIHNIWCAKYTTLVMELKKGHANFGADLFVLGGHGRMVNGPVEEEHGSLHVTHLLVCLAEHQQVHAVEVGIHCGQVRRIGYKTVQRRVLANLHECARGIPLVPLLQFSGLLKLTRPIVQNFARPRSILRVRGHDATSALRETSIVASSLQKIVHSSDKWQLGMSNKSGSSGVQREGWTGRRPRASK